MKPAPLLALIMLAAAFAWLFGKQKTVLDVEGRKFRLVKPGTKDMAQIWEPVPPDGFEYTPDLSWQLGQTPTPIFRRFV